MGHRRTSQADFDLDDIWYYVATKSGSIDTADRVVDSITERFYLLAAHSNIGSGRDQDVRSGLRSFPVSEYVILYRIQGEDVVILRVLRGSRDVRQPGPVMYPERYLCAAAPRFFMLEQIQHEVKNDLF